MTRTKYIIAFVGMLSVISALFILFSPMSRFWYAIGILLFLIFMLISYLAHIYENSQIVKVNQLTMSELRRGDLYTYEDRTYKVLMVTLTKNAQTREWERFVVYHRVDKGAQVEQFICYSRELEEFLFKFREK